MPVGTKVKERIDIAAEVYGLSRVRAEKLWYSDVNTVHAREADRIRAIGRDVVLKQISRLEDQTRALKSHLKSARVKLACRAKGTADLFDLFLEPHEIVEEVSEP